MATGQATSLASNDPSQGNPSIITRFVGWVYRKATILPRIYIVMRIQETEVYTFEELSENAQARAVEDYSALTGEFWSAQQGCYDDFEAVARILGIEFYHHSFTTMGGGTGVEPKISYSGFYSQGDGARFEGEYRYRKGANKAIREYAPEDKELHRIASELQRLQSKHQYGLEATTRCSGHYEHSGCMEVTVGHRWDDQKVMMSPLPEVEVTRLLRDFADWMYSQMRDEYEYQTSFDTCRERLREDDWEFYQDGTPVREH